MACRWPGGCTGPPAPGDATAFAWPAEDFSVLANLPFARSGAILGHLLRDPGVPLRRADVIVQWEFAEKHAAVWPSTLRSTYWRAWFDIAIERRVDPAILGGALCQTASAQFRAGRGLDHERLLRNERVRPN